MLQLRTNNYTYSRAVDNAYKYVNRTIAGPNGCRGVGYIRSAYLEDALLPIAFNEIGILQQTHTIPFNEDGDDLQQEHLDITIKSLENIYDELAQDRLAIVRIYTPDVDKVYNNLNDDFYVSVNDTIKALYNKCMQQVTARCEDTTLASRDAITKVKLMKGKHVVILISNYDDMAQESDYFLTIGLIPILFPDWKEKFNEAELDYFKTLVSRSQVKRVRNVEAQGTFEVAMLSDKYREMFKEIEFKQMIESLITTRINTARSNLYNYQNEAEQLLGRYADIKRKFYEAEKIVRQLETNREDTIEEYKSIFKLDGLINVESRNSGRQLELTFKAPLQYYDEEECELALRHRTDNWAKQMFNDIFIEQKYKINVLTKFIFNFDTTNQRFSRPQALDFQYLKSNNCMFNPHLQYYNCLGDYEAQLIDAEAKGDVLVFNNLALASTKSINFKDATVINRWFEDLISRASYRHNDYSSKLLFESKCLEDEDGKLYSIEEIYLTPKAEFVESVQDIEVRDV